VHSAAAVLRVLLLEAAVFAVHPVVERLFAEAAEGAVASALQVLAAVAVSVVGAVVVGAVSAAVVVAAADAVDHCDSRLVLPNRSLI
jgi:hypothetical protein